ncbi:Autotransporter adhesin [Bibersteinia trehalosi USDA-ARS-USMARC-190]|uniref:Autotransporter adhesin n=1 Tax=Bibersteinia trehalosi USDA-ARS-USMARC-190 TaxID=1263832 RepID=W0RD01_BIBTR|nr:YadA-like family protein [Bibersteinia trehalosi]AHG87253.1 Autotransporter adhesin [Bibersteinia trehalosi USDA-ARS-USMARC-190]
MNKIFKVVWSNSTNKWVVVSELATTYGKSKSSVSMVADTCSNKSALLENVFKLKFITLLLLSSIPMADAAVSIANTNGYSIDQGSSATDGTNSINVGDNSGKQRADGYIGESSDPNENKLNAYNKQKPANASTNNRNNTVSLGTYAYAYGHDSIAIGTNSQAVHDVQTANRVFNSRNSVNAGAIAIGFQAIARGDQTVALGSRAAAYNRQATAIGNDSYAMGTGSTAIGGDDSGYTWESRQTWAAEGNNEAGYKIAGGFNPSKEPDAEWYRPSAASGNGATVVGVHSQALSKGSTALGVAATAGDGGQTSSILKDGQAEGIDPYKNIEATAVGALANAKYRNTTAVGHAAKAIGEYSTSMGDDATANGKNSSAIGKSATANGEYAVAIGNADTAKVEETKTQANGTRAIAVGTAARTDGDDTIAIGTKAKALKANNTAIGVSANIEQAAGTDNIAFGSAANVTRGSNSIVIGKGAKTEAVNGSSIAIGDGAVITSGVQGNAYAIGTGAKVESTYGGIALGNGAKITNSDGSGGAGNGSSVSIGEGAEATGTRAISIGYKANTTGNQVDSIAIGSNAATTGTNNIAIGKDAKANGTQGNQIVMGTNSSAVGDKSIVLGYGAKADGNQVSQIIIGTNATGTNTSQYSVVMGERATASRENSTVLGHLANSTVDGGVALGSGSISDRHAGGSATGHTSTTKPYYPETASQNQKEAINATIATTGAVSVGSSSVRRQITHLAAGAEDSDAVNVAQLKAAVSKAVASSTWYIQENGVEKDVVNSSDEVNFASGIGTTANVTVDSTGKTSTVKYSVNKSNLTVVSDGTVMAQINGDNFATAEQVASAINKAGLSFSGDVAVDTTNKFVRLNQQETKVIGGVTDKTKLTDNNIGVVSNGQDTLTVKLSKNLTALENASFGISDNDKTVINKDGMMITNGTTIISLTETGLNNGGNKVTNVANGTNATDAVNLQQLNASKSVVKAGNYTTVTSTSDANGTVYTVNAEKSVVKAGNNVNVTTETDSKGLTNYTVKVEGDLTNISSITNNGTTIKLDNQNGNKTVDVGGATITNVAAGVNLTDAVNVGQLEKVNATANAGWNVTTNNGNQTYNVKPNATVDLSSSDGNIVIGQKDGNITFALAGNLSNITNISNGDNNSIRLGDNNNITTIISNGTTFTFGAGNTTVNVSGKAELVTGTNSTDVATVGDIIETINGVSWTIVGNGANVSQIKAGDIVNFVDGKNTKASAKVNNGATEVTYNVEGDLTNITSITNNGTTIKLENKDGDKAINVDGATITNVKAGENGTDAVNLDQLNASKSVVKAGNYTTVTSTSDANGTVYTVNAEKSVVVAGTNANVTTTTDGKGLTTYNVSVTGDLTNITSITNNEGNKLTIGNGTTTVDAGKAKVSNNSNATDIATVGDIVNTINNVSWAVAGNGAVKENITAGEVVNFVNGNNTVAVVTANTSTGGADVKFNVEGALSNITSLTNNNGTQITLGDTNNNNVVNVNGANITNVANGTNATDAVNLQQLNASKSVVKAGNYTTVTSISDANGTVYTVNAEKSVVKAGNNVNVTTETDGKGLTNYTVTVEGDLTNISSITNNGTTIKVGVENGNNTVNIGGATITEVKAGVNGTDAVNVDQLEKVNSTANAGWNVSTNKGGTTYNVKPNATVDLRNADGNIVISQDNGNITFDLAGKLTNITNISNGENHSIRLGDNNNVTTIVNNGTTFTFGEGNTTTNATTGKAEVASGSNNTDVATVGDIVETINNVSWTVAGNGSNVSKIKAGDVVNFVNGNNTVAVVKLNETTNATEVTYHVEGDLTNITSITNGNTSIKLGDANGNNTVNINNATISNVAPGVNGTDAVNVDQLEKVNSTANAGWNLTVNTGENGTNISPNATVDLRNSDGNIVITKDANNVTFDLNNTLTVGGKDGKDGQMGVAGKDGKDGVTIYGNGTIGINGKDGIPGKDGQPGMNGSNATVTVVEGTPGINGKDGETLTRVVYTDANGTTHEIATLDDGLKFKGDKGEVIAKKLGETLDIIGKAKDDAAVTDKNLRVDSEGGQLVIKMASDLRDINNITSSNGNTTITLSDSNGNNTVNINNATISNVAPGVNGTDAVNVDQLEKVNVTANAGWNLTVNTGENGTNISPNATVDLRNSDGNIVITKDANNVTFDLNSTLTIGGKDGQDGQMGVAGKDGADGVTIYGNGTIGINGKDGIPGKDGQPGMNGSNATVTVVEGTPSINGKDGETLTRVVYTDANGTTHEIATLDDGLKFKGDKGEVIAKKLGETLEIIGRTDVNANVTDKNLRVDNEEGKLVLKMAKELQEINSISNNNGTTITLGDANNNNTVNINNATISNVAPGVNGTDAVNVDQLEKVNATANAGWTITTNEGNATYNVKPNATVDLRNADGNIVISQDNGNITFDLNSTLTIGGKGKDGVDGKDGQLGVAGKDGADGVTIYGNGTIGINGRDGVDGKPGANASVTVVEGTPGINGKDGETLTRVVYTDANGTTHEIATLDDGLKFKGDKGEVIAKKLGETLEIIGRTDVNANVTDKNLRVDNENGKLVLKMAKELQEINSISNNNGTTITLGDANNNNTVNINNATISNVAPGVNGTDAVNVDQLEKVNATANAGWTITTNEGNATYNVKPNATVDLRNADGNIVISQDNGNITFDLNSTLTIGGKDGKDGQMGVAGKDGADGVTIYGNGTIGINGRDGVDGKPGANASVTVIEGTPGINGKDGETLTRVVYTDANGTTHEIATLDDGLKFKGDKGEVIAKKLGETLEIIGRTDVNANVTDKNLRVDNEEGKLVLKMAKELQEINSISNNNGTTITLGDANNNNTVNINNATISNVAPGVNGTDAVNVDQLEKVNATANAGWTITTNEGNATYNVKPNATVDLRNADGNIVISQDNGNITFDLNSTLTIGGKDGKDGQMGVAGKDGADGVTIYGNGTIGINGRDGVDGKPGANASVTVVEGTPGINGKDGETLTRVVYTDANGTTHEIATLDDGLKFKGDTGEVIAKKLGETLEIIGRTDVNANVTDKNLRVDNENGQLVLKMAKELQEINSISNNNGTTITLGDANNNNTVNINNATISNVAPGVNGTDAVNVDQLEKVNATANAGWFMTTNHGDKSFNVKPNASVDLRTANNNLVITQEDGNITFGLSNNLNLTSNGSVTIGNTTIDNSGLTIKDGPSITENGVDAGDKKVTNVSNGTISAESKDAINGSQLYAVKQIAEAGWNLSVNEGEDAGNVAPGANVDLRNSDGNIVISKDANNVTFNLAKDIKVDTLKANTSVTVGNDTVHTSIMNNGITVKGENSTVTLTDKGLDNGGNKITNVAAGTNATDAVNVSQLNSTIAGVQWKLTGNNDNANATTVGSQTVSFNDSESVKANVDGVNVSFSVKAGELGNEAGKVTSNSTNGTVATVKNVADAINNSGWNIALTDGSNELVKPGDIVKFVNGSGTTANVAKNANGGVEVSFNVNNAEAPKVNEDGSINVPSSENGGSHYVNATTLATTVNNAAWNVDSKAAGGTVINVVNEKRVDSQAATKVKAGNTVNINAGNNIEITRSGADITVATSMTPTFNTVQVGGKEGVTLGSSTAKDGVKELSVGARGAEARITNVAPGIADTDAVNVGQLRGAVGNIHNHINKVDRNLRAGIAGANAAAGLPQVYIPGKLMVAAAAGTFKGQSAVAVGYSRASDNGKVILKLQGNANTRGDFGGSVGVGYQW